MKPRPTKSNSSHAVELTQAQWRNAVIAQPTKGNAPLDKITTEEWRDALLDAYRIREDVVPECWLSTDKVARMLGSSPRGVAKQLVAMQKARVIERRLFRISRSDGRVTPMPHYRLTKKKTA